MFDPEYDGVEFLEFAIYSGNKLRQINDRSEWKMTWTLRLHEKAKGVSCLLEVRPPEPLTFSGNAAEMEFVFSPYIHISC